MKQIVVDRLQQEISWLTVTVCLGLVSLMSGSLLLLPLGFPDWLQINLVIHVLVGSISAIPIGYYCLLHFKRTLGIRSSSLIFSGLMACLLFCIVFLSGLWIAVFGQSEQYNWVDKAHALATYSSLAIIVWHIISHTINKTKKQKPNLKDNKSIFITLQKNLNKTVLFSLIAYTLLLMILNVVYLSINSSTNNNIDNYAYDYGDHPFRPSQTETASGYFVKTEQIAKSQQCGSCHNDIYQQWLSSTHRQAASDPAYVKNINLLEKNRGITATRYCEGCHAPVALLTGELTPGGKHGGVPDTPAHLEGVGCMGCHGIDKVVHLNGVASYEFSPKEFYLFDSSANQSAQLVRNFLIRLKPDKHKQAMNPNLMQDPKLCASCHEQFMDESMNNWGWVKMQSEYNDWLASPFSGQNEKSFQNENLLTCQNCHFPLVAGSDPSADKNGFIHSHRSLGANTVLPLLNGDKEQLDATINFLQSSRILVDIVEPHRQDTVQNHHSLDQHLRPQDQDNTPFFFYLDETINLQVTVTNRMVGHNFPAGTTDINQAWLYFKVTDANNRTVYASGELNDDLKLDKNAHTYHSVPVDRTGKAIWKHDLFRMTGDSYKNVIPAGKSDIKEYQFNVPSWAKTPLTATAIVKYRKFNQRYAQWALNHPRPVLPVVEMARSTLNIPLKIKPITQ